jgi:hypothetical protein
MNQGQGSYSRYLGNVSHAIRAATMGIDRLPAIPVGWHPQLWIISVSEPERYGKGAGSGSAIIPEFSEDGETGLYKVFFDLTGMCKDPSKQAITRDFAVGRFVAFITAAAGYASAEDFEEALGMQAGEWIDSCFSPQGNPIIGRCVACNATQNKRNPEYADYTWYPVE